MNRTSSLQWAQNCLAQNRWGTMRCWVGVLVLVVMATGCATTSGPPCTKDIQTSDGKQNAVLLLRVIAEVEGRTAPPFPSRIAWTDNIALGVGDFWTGGKIQAAKLRFLSDDTRNEGWTYLLLEPGQIYYLAAHEPISTGSMDYDALWEVCPRWSIELPANGRLIYGGTLYLPGTGRWMLFRAKQLAEFDRAHVEVRDESGQAEQIAKRWFASLGLMSVQLAKKWELGDTIILQTPPEESSTHR